jgi:NTP pyrophosphatase (non-canonical NTP hydrolase)
VGTPAISDHDALLAYLGLGIASEAGEVAGEIKKLLRDEKWNAPQAIEELGDVAYYFARLCIALGQKPSELLDRSISKIEARITSHRELADV